MKPTPGAERDPLESNLDVLSLAAVTAELSELYLEHAASLLRYATSYAGNQETARDAVQDCFLRYFELRCAGIELKRPKAWLMRVIKNCLIDSNRRERRQKQAGAAVTPDPPWLPAGAGSEHLEAARLWRQIGELVSPQELKCLRLRAAGFTYGEIASALGVQPGTVSVLLSRSREKAGPLLQGDRVQA
jgi:RNA polymerase sigma-70 factor (ECF subfamily)